MTPPKIHWILRVTPESHRERVKRIGLIIGALCSMVWMLGAFAGLFLAPILFSVWRPAAPISQPVLWLQRTSGSEWFILTYSVAMVALIGIIRTGCTFFDHVTNNRNA